LAGSFVSAGHQVVCLGSGSRKPGVTVPDPVIQWSKHSPEAIDLAIKEHRPDVLLTIGDPWMFLSVPKLPMRKSVAWLAYYPVDGYPLPPAWADWCRAVDAPVVFSKFACEIVRMATGTSPALIYHGVDTKRFHPGDRARAKKLAGVGGHFVVGTVARNQMRKNIPALADGQPEAHMGHVEVVL
jgi:glycosyltransferase involved in cell wall biosynthesis